MSLLKLFTFGLTFCVFANSDQSWKEHELFLKYQEITNWRLDRLEKLNGLSPPEEIKASLTSTFDAAISSKSETNSESLWRDTDRTLQQSGSSYDSSVISVQNDNSSITFGLLEDAQIIRHSLYTLRVSKNLIVEENVTANYYRGSGQFLDITKNPVIVALLATKTTSAPVAASPTTSPSNCGPAIGTTYSFSYTGNLQSFTVPACVTQMTIEARGAQGGSSSMGVGRGASMKGTFVVTPGQVFSILVGGQGEESH